MNVYRRRNGVWVSGVRRGPAGRVTVRLGGRFDETLQAELRDEL
jgi:hypothetical protein